MAKAYRVCALQDLPPGQRKIVEIAGKSIGVFNVGGRFYAIRNICPHQRAPLCEGTLSGTTLPGKVGEFHHGYEGQILRCPWHGWEFDITTGQSVFNPHKVRVKAYQVTVEQSDGSTATRTIGCDQPDPALETYPIQTDQTWLSVVV